MCNLLKWMDFFEDDDLCNLQEFRTPYIHILNYKNSKIKHLPVPLIGNRYNIISIYTWKLESNRSQVIPHTEFLTHVPFHVFRIQIKIHHPFRLVDGSLNTECRCDCMRTA
jgi:hypothetical protein